MGLAAKLWRWVDLGGAFWGGNVASALIHYRDSLTTFRSGFFPFFGCGYIIDGTRRVAQLGSIVTSIGDSNVFVPTWR